MPTLNRLPSRSRRVLAAIATLGLSLLSCGRDVTGPGEGLRYASGLSFLAQFPAPLAEVADGAGSVVPFERVRVVFRRADGTVALDTSIVFPANADSMALDLRVPLASGAPASGEPMALSLDYVNAAGDTVFRGGPVPIVAVPRAAGSPPPEPAPVPLTYTGPGATATSLDVTPETLTVVAGDAFSFSATALDGQGAPVANAPIVFTSLDATRATLTARNAGAGTTTTLRGTARVLAQLVTGAADDTVTLVVLPRAATLTMVSGNAQTAAPSAALGAPVSVRLLATDNQPMANVTVTAAVTTGGGTVTPTSGITDANGVASFAWTLGATLGAQSLTFSVAGVPSLVASATAVVSTAAQLVITQELGSSYQAGDSLPALLVEARTAGGALDASFADSVFLGFAVNPNGATISGTARVRAVAGVARFDNFRLTRAGTGYRLLVTAPPLQGDTSNVVDVTARAASVLTLASGGGQGAAPSTALPQPVVLRVADGYDNPVAGVTVNFSVATGSVSAPSGTSAASGTVSVNWTLGAAGGVQTLTATSAGLTGSPLSVTAIASSGVVTTTLAPTFDTLTAIGANRLLVATARDAASAVVPGAFTWLSRNPAIASVNDSGRVVAVSNGETWVVATEVGGTRDSARIVVQQRLASIAVTPANRSIYLGAQFAYSASAVDGLGVPLIVQPTFTWSSSTPAIATVDSIGVARGVGLGATQVRATASSVTGTANLTVLTPITRIAVIRDSVNFVATDTFTLNALAQTRSYRAVAYDTLDVAMTGITFTWASSNPSVATLDSTGITTARARAAANGFTAVRASAQGVTGAAALTVAQQMASIELTPGSVIVAVSGQVVLTPRRLDANGFFIPGGTFTFASANPAIATVSGAGVVTGVELGATTMTASSGATTSNAIAVNVSAGAPPIISFGRDTLAIGRSATNVGFPVYLSRPNPGSAVVVNLAVADTFAFFSPTSVSIPAGQTVGTAFLNGRNAGTTRVFAVDGSGTGFAGDTAVLAVQAAVRFTTTSYSMIATQEVSTQILLTDPAPSGGTFITYTYGTPGRASVSPDPAFIPAGQLAANVVIRGLSAGSTTITPAATGVSGTSTSVSVSAAALAFSTPFGRLGTGQYQDNVYVYASGNVTAPLTVNITSSDSSIVSAPSQVTIPAGTYYVYFAYEGRATGTATLTFSSPGWTGTSATVSVTTPKLRVSGGGTFNTTNPTMNASVSSADSVNNDHYRSSGLAVQLTSSDTTVLRVLTPNATVGAGQYFTTVQVAPGGTPGTARLIATASGHRPDSVNYTFVGPKLQLSWGSLRIGAGQRVQNLYAYTPNNVTTPLNVTFTTSNPAVASVPSGVTIPNGTYYQYFDVSGTIPGSISIIATAPGYEPDTATVTVTSPRLYLSGGGNLNNFAAPAALTSQAGDSVSVSGYTRLDTLIVTHVSSDPSVVTVTAADTILPGQYSTSRARVTPIGTGTAQIISSAPGHGADTVTYTVLTPKLNINFATYRIGQRQFRPATGENYVYTPDNRTTPLVVTFTQTNPAVDSLSSTTVTIPNGIYYSYFGFAGLSRGVDTLIASAPGYLPDTAVIVVTTPRYVMNNIAGTATTTSPSTTVRVHAADSVGTAHYVLDAVRVGLASTNSSVVAFDSTAVMIPAGNYFVDPRFRYLGPGSAALFVGDSSGLGYVGDTTNAVTVTGPSLTMSNGRPILGMRQTGLLSSSYVQIPNPIGTNLVVTLISTDSTVARVQPTVTIPAGQTFAYFRIDAGDAVGTVQIQASAPGYGPTFFTQQVTTPRFLISTVNSTTTTALPSAITVQAADANGTAHYVSENVSVTLTSSNALAGVVDSATVVIVAGDYFNNRARFVPGLVGSTTITASDARGTAYSYTSATSTIGVNQPNLSLNWSSLSMGVGQYEDRSVSVPNTRLTPLTVGFAHPGTAVAVPVSSTINIGGTTATLRVSGVALGNDSVTATALGHNNSAAQVTVGLGRVDGLSGLPTTINAGTDSVLVTLFVRAPDTGVRRVTSATTFALSVTGTAFELRSGGVAISSVTVPADGQSVAFYIRRLAAGTGTFSLSNANYTPYTTPTITVNP